MIRFITSALLALSISGALCAPNQTDEQWSSPFAGWHARATPHPDPQEFLQGISPASLDISSTDSTQFDPSRFTLAMFTVPHIGPLQAISHVVVDALGRVLIPDPSDAAGIISVTERIPLLSPWVIGPGIPITDRPIDSVVVPNGDGFTEIKITGFTKATRELQQPVGGIPLLPHALWELFGLVLEARNGVDRDAIDLEVVNRVKEVIGQL